MSKVKLSVTQLEENNTSKIKELRQRKETFEKNDTKIRWEEQARNSELCPRTQKNWFESFIKTLISVFNIKNKFILTCIKKYKVIT